jgi:hypothetical protein
MSLVGDMMYIECEIGTTHPAMHVRFCIYKVSAIHLKEVFSGICLVRLFIRNDPL